MKRLFNTMSTAALVAVLSALAAGQVHAQVTVSANWVQSSAQGPTARAGASMDYDSIHQVAYLFGGSASTSSDLLGDTWEYDGSTWTQLRVNGPSPRYLAPMVFDTRRGVSVLFGGYSNGVRGDTWEWNGSSWTQKFPANSPPLRLWTAMAYDSIRHVTVLFGGAFDTGPLDDTWEYGGNSWSQVVTAHAPSPRRGMGLAFDQVRGRVVLFGGQDANGVDLNDTWEFDGTDWSQVATSSAPAPRLWHSMAYDPALGGTILFGGAAAQNVPQNDTWLYDGTTWEQVSSPVGTPIPRFWAGVAFDSGRSSLLLFGGGDTPSATGGSVFGDTWSLQGVTTSPIDWALANPSTSPPDRVFSAMDYDSARGVSVLFSGSSDGGSAGFQDTWEWNGSSWMLRTPSVSPPALAGAAMAYDGTRHVSVLFGGSGSSGASAATWEWDGTAWTQRTPGTSPSARVWAAMAYDSAHARMVLFGGNSAAGDTWTYDGTTWTHVFPASSPSPRMGAAMAYDPTRGRVVLFGGRDVSGQRLQDTWEWDGANWTQTAPAVSPYARFWASMAFDAQRGKVVLFGGDHIQPFGLGEENDTWDWDGSQWTRDWTAAAPPVRAGHGMAYDSARGRIVLFGGMNPSTSPGTFYGDTWELGSDIETPPGTPNATLLRGSTSFGSVNVGSTSSLTSFGLTSTGTGPLTINSISTTGDFAVTSTDCPSAANVLASGAYCLTLVAFTPTASGQRTGSLTISDNDPNGGFVVQLQGTGVQIPTLLSTTPVVGLFNTSATLSATLRANGSPLANEPVSFTLPSGATSTFTTNAEGTATWPGASLSGVHAGTFPNGIQASFAGAGAYAASSVSAALTITQPVTTNYSGSFFVADNVAPALALTVDQRTPSSDRQFLDYGATSVWVRFTVTGPSGSSDFFAPVSDAPDWTTSGLGVASVNVAALPDGAYTVIANLVNGSGSSVASVAVAGDDARVGLASSPTKGGYLSGGGAVAADPSANTADTHGYFSFQMKPTSAQQGGLVYMYRTAMDVGGGNVRDVDVWVMSTDVTALSGNGSSAIATGHFSVAYVDAQTGQRYSSFEFGGGTYKLSVTNGTTKAPAGFSLVLKRSDGTLFHTTAPVNNGGNAPTVPVVLGTLVSNL